jgi:D-alanyl-D-alanine dipeptidase
MQKLFFLKFVFSFLLFFGQLSWAQIEGLDKNPDFVNIGKYENVIPDVRYATTNNFTHQNLYGEYKSLYLHKTAAEKFKKATELLKKEKPGWKFLVFDALRPRSVQQKLWDKVKGTDQQQYVADPTKGSVHNFGFALDLSLQDEKGQEVDMGTPYDSFEDKAQPKFEEKMLKSGQLTQTQVNNRLVLRKIMTAAGFIQLPNEWWHYDALPNKEVRKKFKIVE